MCCAHISDIPFSTFARRDIITNYASAQQQQVQIIHSSETAEGGCSCCLRKICFKENLSISMQCCQLTHLRTSTQEARHPITDSD